MANDTVYRVDSIIYNLKNGGRRFIIDTMFTGYPERDIAADRAHRAKRDLPPVTYQVNVAR